VAERRPDAFEAALAALRRRERSSAEVVAWLERRGYDAAQVEAAIARLTEAGELDDARFARRYAEDKRELRGWGTTRIHDALQARGIAPATLEAALEGESEATEVGRARDLLIRRSRPLSEQADRTRALGFLTRRGYDYEVAYEAIRLASRDAA
jgi:regulatory protein